jgi:hypothetical protein
VAHPGRPTPEIEAPARGNAGASTGQRSIQEGTPAAGESTHKPRVLAISPPEVEAPISPNEQKITPKIERSQMARVRTLVRYGMTARQVAEVYGVDVDEISRILRRT